jgi:hypothetical protein
MKLTSAIRFLLSLPGLVADDTHKHVLSTGYRVSAVRAKSLGWVSQITCAAAVRHS